MRLPTLIPVAWRKAAAVLWFPVFFPGPTTNALVHDLSDALSLAQAVKVTRSVAYFHDAGIAQETLVLGCGRQPPPQR